MQASLDKIMILTGAKPLGIYIEHYAITLTATSIAVPYSVELIKSIRVVVPPWLKSDENVIDV